MRHDLLAEVAVFEKSHLGVPESLRQQLRVLKGRIKGKVKADKKRSLEIELVICNPMTLK